jgi:hypothetical protein
MLPTQASAGLQRTWKHAAILDGQDPTSLRKLPFLFGSEVKIGIARGCTIRKVRCGDAGALPYCLSQS